MNMQIHTIEPAIVSGEGWSLSLPEMTATLAEVLVHSLQTAGVSDANILLPLLQTPSRLELFTTSDTHACCTQDFNTSFGLDDDFFFAAIAQETQARPRFAITISLEGNAFTTNLEFSEEGVRHLDEWMES